MYVIAEACSSHFLALCLIMCDLASARHFHHWWLIFESDEYFPYPIRHMNFQKIVEKWL